MGLVPPVGKVGSRPRDCGCADQIAHLGIGYVPEIAQVSRADGEADLEARAEARIVGRWKFGRACRSGPARRSGRRACRGRGRCSRCAHADGRPDLVIDEPTEGLAPKLVEQVGRLRQIAKRARRSCWSAEEFAVALKTPPTLWATAAIVFEGTPPACRQRGIAEWLEVGRAESRRNTRAVEASLRFPKGRLPCHCR